MLSTGNDIVVLAMTDAERTCQVRFHSRILIPGEVALYEELVGSQCDRAVGVVPDFSSFVWLLWSIKESVYKYVSRSDRRLVFAPLKIPVGSVNFRDGYFEGIVRYGLLTLYSRSFFRDGTIMTVVSEEREFCAVRWGVRAIDDAAGVNQSGWVRVYALESLSGDVPGSDLRIVKSPDGPPEVWDGDDLLDIPISLAHHGRYVAWSYRLDSRATV
jgi:hypothetical protein